MEDRDPTDDTRVSESSGREARPPLPAQRAEMLSGADWFFAHAQGMRATGPRPDEESARPDRPGD